jgi:hypothetical protein
MTDQSKNTRRAKLLTVDGITKTQNEWAKTIGVDPATLCERIKKYGPEVSIKMGRRTHGTIN